jgi:pSer/pThr/pTyr-binding forkhead associated (FHA) protein
MSANRCRNPKCEYFNKTLPNNAKFCPWCNTPLGNVVTPPPISPPIPPPIPESDDSTTIQPIKPPIPPPPPAPRLPLLTLIHSSGREFQWSGEAGFIGRRSQNTNIPPEIDLTGIPNEGIISRRHGRVTWDWVQNSYMILEMSTNGTSLNGTALSPGVQYRLMNGDVLQLGQDNLVRFTVYVV